MSDTAVVGAIQLGIRGSSPNVSQMWRRWGCAFLGSIFFLGLSETAHAADSSTNDLEKLRLELVKEQAKLARQEDEIKQQEEEVVRQTLHLNSQAQLLDRELKKLRGTGVGSSSTEASSTAGAGSVPVAGGTQAPDEPIPTTAQVADESQSTPTAASPTDSAPIVGPSQAEAAARRTLQTAPVLQSSGGVLTPRGQFVIDSSFEYDYWNQNQLSLNGFTIIPGITFGNIFISKEQQNIVTTAVTGRWGVTDRLELNVKIPAVYNYSQWTAQQAGPNAQFLYANANNFALGDIQFGASYQINTADSGWPIFVGNLLVKTATGVSPFSVPIITVNDPNGQFLEGILKKAPTGTGFWSVEPSVTILYPSAPGVWFGNIQYIYNVPATVSLQNPEGGPATSAYVTPGSAIAATFGIGFAMNDRTSLSLSYQQTHYFSSKESDSTISGSSYDFGIFNFGVGYQISKSTNLNIGVGIGAGPDAPAAKILIDVPYRF